MTTGGLLQLQVDNKLVMLPCMHKAAFTKRKNTVHITSFKSTWTAWPGLPSPAHASSIALSTSPRSHATATSTGVWLRVLRAKQQEGHACSKII